MEKKHVRYYLVVTRSSTAYHKVECDYIFSEQEGVDHIKKSTPDATRIKHIAKSKAEGFLGLGNNNNN